MIPYGSRTHLPKCALPPIYGDIFMAQHHILPHSLPHSLPHGLAGLAFVALLAVPTAACGSGDGSSDVDAGEGPIEIRGGCEAASRVGGFRVEVTERFSSVSGTVLNGVLPITIREEVTSEGDCKITRRLNPLCDPGCGATEVCELNGTCIEEPRSQDIGTVTITGLEEAVSMEPAAPGNNYQASVSANPIFAPDAEIRLSGSGEPIALGGFGSDPLALSTANWRVAQGESFALSWTAPASQAPKTNLHFSLSIDQHGTSPVELECAFPDNGTAAIPSSLIDRLLTEGISGFPNGTATRRTQDRVTTSDGCVDLTVASKLEDSVEVVGHTPCMRDTDCTPPQTCDIPNQTCVDPSSRFESGANP